MPGMSAAHSTKALNETIFNDIVRWASEAPEQLNSLYESPYAVQCIFRALPPIARLYVSRLLYVDVNSAEPIGIDGFRDCLRRRQRAHDRHDQAIRALKAFRILVEDHGSDLRGEVVGMKLHDGFALQIRACLAGNLAPVFGGEAMDIDDGQDKERDAAFWDKFSAGKLEKILNFLVESSGLNSPQDSIMDALLRTSILEDKRDGLCITSSGFQFLLKDSFSQVWILLRSIINIQHHGEEFAILNFIFKLSFAKPGVLYSDPDLSSKNHTLLSCLHDLGVIYLEENSCFRPTAVGTQLLAAASRISTGPSSLAAISRMKTGSSALGDIQIVVETNFRVYAYTTSGFQMNLIGLFTHLRYRLPNLVVCHLTRDAVRRALMNGINADQIIAYLNAHAHPRMKKGVIPSNVSDELRLWEGEQERVQAKKSLFLSDFENAEDFNRVMAYADELGARLWADVVRKQLVVSEDAADSVRNFIRSQRMR